MSQLTPGIKTTEFWLTLFGANIPIISSLFGLNLPVEGILAAVGTIISYIAGRTVTKKRAATSGAVE